jgi:hypothetical protein
MRKSVWKIRPDGRTVRRHNKGKIEGPFVPLLKDTLKTPAWKALSYGARALYVVLKWRYNGNLMNAVYVATRLAADELGAGRNNVKRWFRELEFYGFIVKVRAAHMGVNGHGRAAHWRLTDVKYLGKEPTREFLQWDGTLFAEPSRDASRLHRLQSLKNKTRGSGVGPIVGPASAPYGKSENGTSGSGVGAMSANRSGSGVGPITSKPLATAERAKASPGIGHDEGPPFDGVIDLPAFLPMRAPAFGIGHNAGPPWDWPDESDDLGARS